MPCKCHKDNEDCMSSQEKFVPNLEMKKDLRFMRMTIDQDKSICIDMTENGREIEYAFSGDLPEELANRFALLISEALDLIQDGSLSESY